MIHADEEWNPEWENIEKQTDKESQEAQLKHITVKEAKERKIRYQ